MRKLRSSTRGATELHLLDAHPTAYELEYKLGSHRHERIHLMVLDGEN